MEDIYDDLENFNDVNVVNELRAENEKLKEKLGQYAESMATLQKDFDNLSAELKKLETNYSSLLKSARIEIKRKTDMIKNLNIEKDMLVLKQFQDKPEQRQKFMNIYKVKAEGNVKKKNNPNTGEDLKQRDEFRKSPSEDSSTATEKSIKSLSTENRVADCAKSTARSMSKENETQQNEEFTNHRETYHDDRLQGAGVTDRRISTITRQQFLKFSSDEEFEDLYSELEPKPTSKGTSFGDEPQKGQKRVRDDPQHARVYNESGGPQDKRLNYTEMPRDRFNKNRNKRCNETERNMTRDKYDLPHQNRNKYSPDRARYGRRDFGEERFGQQYDRQRWTEHAPGDWYQDKRRERRPYSDRSRSDQNLDMGRHNYPDTNTGKHRLASSTQIHGEYDQPPMKRFRGDKYPRTDEDRRRNDRQFPHEYHPSEIKEAYQHTQINDELVSSIYADLDKPMCDSAVLTGDGNINKSNHDMGSKMDVAVQNDLQSIKKDNVKENFRSKHTEENLNDGENTHSMTKYKIPLKGHKLNDAEHLDKSKRKSKVDISRHGGVSGRSSLPHKDLPLVNDCIKNSEVVETQESLKLNNTDPAIFPSKTSKIGKNDSEGSTSFKRELEQKLSSIRNIVEGDLELSDETNDDTQVQLKDNELPDTKRKNKTKKKSRRDSSKDKIATRKTRSKTDKDKDVKAKNKFSELFGDSSSLITPEDLDLTPTSAPALITDTYVAVCEDAQDGTPLQDKQNGVRTVAAKKEILGPDSNLILPQTDCFYLNEKSKTKDTKDIKSRVHHRKHRKSELTSNDDVKDLKEITFSNIVNPPTTESILTTSLSDVEKKLLSETPTERVQNESETKTKDDVPETILMPEVSSVASFKHCKNTPDETKLNKKTRSDSITTISMPEVNTAVTSEKSKDILNVNKHGIIETHSKPKVKTSSDGSKEISDCLKPNKKTESDMLKAHLTPEVKSVASVDKSKEISNSSKPDKKTENDIVEPHFIPDVKTMASSEKSGEVFDVIKSSGCKKDPVIEIPPMVKAKPAVSREKSHEVRNVTKIEKNKCGEKNKDHPKSSKKSKSNEDKMLPSSGNSKELYVSKNHSVLELNKPSIKSSNKENESCVKVSHETMNRDLPQTFEDTLVPIENTSVDKITMNEEKLTMSMIRKETISDTTIDDTPNLEAVTEDSGLVNTVVISSGIQPSDATILPVNPESHYTSLKALATSTPTRELPTLNTLSEIKPYGNSLTSSVNIKTSNENPVSNEDSDIPDVRIYCYRRRRKLRT